jgi:hypothetical protein
MSAPEGKTDVPREPGHFRFWTRFGSAPRRWQIVRMLEAGAIRLLLGEDRMESCSGQNTSIVGKRGSAVMQSQR